MKTKQSEDTPFSAYFSLPDTEGKRPGILIAHAWKGQDDFARGIADDLAKQGYVAMAGDVYGTGILANNNEEAAALMTPLFLDRSELRKRITAAYHTLCAHPQVDAQKTIAIGFCFGGLTVLELMRSGAPLKGIVSFHGTLIDAMGSQKAQLAPPAKTLQGSALFLHGHEDPLMTQNDVTKLTTELTSAEVDWQFISFGHTVHAFTNPEVNAPELGLVYQPRSAQRAWNYCHQFFEEIL